MSIPARSFKDILPAGYTVKTLSETKEMKYFVFVLNQQCEIIVKFHIVGLKHQVLMRIFRQYAHKKHRHSRQKSVNMPQI